jgi:microcin C transport system permease protein
MYKYIIKRLILIIPTLFAILAINFFIIQTAPGGPMEQILSRINNDIELNGDIEQNQYHDNLNNHQSSYGIDPEIIRQIEQSYGFDQPLGQRFWLMIKKFIKFDFGSTIYQDKKVTQLILEKLPVSISLGIWTTLLIYLISIPLGIKKAICDGAKFDIASSTIIIICNAIPSFIFAILLITLFASGNFFNIFPIRGIVSANFDQLNWWQKILDYLWHIFLPILAMVIGGFAALTFFVKNSFIEEINKQYVICARAKGLKEKQVIYRHIFRNAMLIIIANLPSTIFAVLFTSSMLIEIIFSLDGLGLLGYEAVISRDYPVIFASLYIFTLIGLIMNIISDIAYKIIDPRINFESNKL